MIMLLPYSSFIYSIYTYLDWVNILRKHWILYATKLFREIETDLIKHYFVCWWVFWQHFVKRGNGHITRKRNCRLRNDILLSALNNGILDISSITSLIVDWTTQFQHFNPLFPWWKANSARSRNSACSDLIAGSDKPIS